MEKSLNGEFLRMQQLAGIENKYTDILLELKKPEIQNNFKKLDSDSKTLVKDVIDDLKGEGYSPIEIIDDLNNLFKNLQKSDIKPKSTKGIGTLFSLARSRKKNLKEADKGTLTDINQLDNLQVGDTFKWGGQELPDAKYKGYLINDTGVGVASNLGLKKIDTESGLIPQEEYNGSSWSAGGALIMIQVLLITTLPL